MSNLPEIKTKWLPKLVETLPRVDGKVFAITGTTSGTGFAAAHVVGNLGGTVLLLNRASKRSEEMLQKLQELAPTATFVPVECDLQDFESVRTAAAKIIAEYDMIDCIANNAGVMALDDIATKDGYDVQMQTNHLSHFLLVKELFPLLQTAAEEHGEARIVNHSSNGRNFGMAGKSGLDEKFLGKNGGHLGGSGVSRFGIGGPSFERYFQSKLANTVFTHAMENRCLKSNPNIKSFSCHPGGSTTNLGSSLTPNFATKALSWIAGFIYQSAEDGAMGLIRCMVDPTVERGQLYGPGNNGTKGPAVLIAANQNEVNAKKQDMLWSMSEAAVGEFKV